MQINGNGIAAKPSLDQIIRDYGPKVYNLVRRMLGNDTDAEDVTQDALLRVIRNLDKYRGEASLGTWVYRIAVNAALAHREKRARREEREFLDAMDQYHDNGNYHHHVRPWHLDPSTQLASKETGELIEKAIAKLPDIYRDVFVLNDVEGLPGAEIAEILNLSLPAVKSRLHRARLFMRNALARHFEEVPT